MGRVVVIVTSCSSSLSSMYFLAAALAPSACFLNASLEAMSEACWDSSVARRRNNLHQTTACQLESGPALKTQSIKAAEQRLSWKQY